jgi:hypothetical protein
LCRPPIPVGRMVATTFTRDFGRMNPLPALAASTLIAIA